MNKKTELEEQQKVKKTNQFLTFAEFCQKLQGYRFYTDSDHLHEIHKFELFFFGNLRIVREAFVKYEYIKKPGFIQNKHHPIEY